MFDNHFILLTGEGVERRRRRRQGGPDEGGPRAGRGGPGKISNNKATQTIQTTKQ